MMRTALNVDKGVESMGIRLVDMYEGRLHKGDLFFFSSRRRHTRYWRDWSSDVCSSDLYMTEK